MKATPAIIVRSLVFNFCYAAWAVISSIIFAPLFLISSHASIYAGRPWAWLVIWMARVICGIRYEVRGAEYLREGPFIFASKHQSAWETAFFFLYILRPAYVLKKELLRIPLWGWYLWRMKMIYIDRHAGMSAMKDMIRQSKDAIAKNRPIIIFPEGTRLPPGAATLYHPGVTALYSQLKVPVIPVALNSGVFWGKNSFIKYPGTVIVECLPPIPPGMPKDQFLKTLEDSIEAASRKLVDG